MSRLTITLMLLRRVGRFAAKVGTACILAGGAFALSATGAQAAPAALTNHPVSGTSSAISCMTASRCVAVGYGARGAHGHGDVVALTGGKQGRISVVAASVHLDSVSCPSSAGCWAVGLQNGGANLVFARIGAAGRVAGVAKVAVPFGVQISTISCVSMTSCGVLGDNNLMSPAPIEIGTWSGKRLTLHKVAGAHGSTATNSEGIACKQAACLAVGYYLKSPKISGFLLTMNHGKPGKQHLVSNDYLYGVSCVSPAKCYAAGVVAQAAGVVVTVTHGLATHAQMETADVSGIECAGATCRASGEEPGGSSYYGVIVTLSNGINTGMRSVDTGVAGFNGPNTIARRGGGFAAIGPTPRAVRRWQSASRASPGWPPMPVVPLGGSELRVSRLALGSWRTYERIRREQGVAVMRAARQAGVNFLDDARYNDETGDAPIPTGYSEIVFGELFRAAGWRRDEVVISNKLWWEFWPDQTPAEELTGSLQRMGLDHVDLIYSEVPPDGVPLEAAIGMITDLITAGLARAWGTLNWPPALMEQAWQVASRIGAPGPCATQLPYSLVTRDVVEDRQLQHVAADRGIAIVASYALAGGVLTGKYADDAAAGRAAGQLGTPRYAAAAAAGRELAALAADLGRDPAHLALAFALLNPSVTTVLLGATRPEQVRANVGALAVAGELTPAEHARLPEIGS